MEGRAKFNIEHALQEWKQSLAENFSLTTENIVELESHLWDTIEALQKEKNISEEEAFFLAKEKMGDTTLLKKEFHKVNPRYAFFTKIFPYLKGIFIYLALTSIIRSLHALLYYVGKINDASVFSFQTISISFLCFCGLILFAISLFQWKNGKFIVPKNFLSLPLLIFIKIIGDVSFVSYIWVFQTADEISNEYHSTGEYFSEIMNNHAVFGDVLIGLILTAIIYLHYAIKKSRKAQFAQRILPFLKGTILFLTLERGITALQNLSFYTSWKMGILPYSSHIAVILSTIIVFAVISLLYFNYQNKAKSIIQGIIHPVSLVVFCIITAFTKQFIPFSYMLEMNDIDYQLRNQLSLDFSLSQGSFDFISVALLILYSLYISFWLNQQRKKHQIAM